MEITDEQVNTIKRQVREDGSYAARRALYERLLDAQTAREQRVHEAKVERIYKTTGVVATDVQAPFKEA